jgi:hypothetical protein
VEFLASADYDLAPNNTLFNTSSIYNRGNVTLFYGRSDRLQSFRCSSVVVFLSNDPAHPYENQTVRCVLSPGAGASLRFSFFKHSQLLMFFNPNDTFFSYPPPTITTFSIRAVDPRTAVFRGFVNARNTRPQAIIFEGSNFFPVPEFMQVFYGEDDPNLPAGSPPLKSYQCDFLPAYSSATSFGCLTVDRSQGLNMRVRRFAPLFLLLVFVIFFSLCSFLLMLTVNPPLATIVFRSLSFRLSMEFLAVSMMETPLMTGTLVSLSFFLCSIFSLPFSLSSFFLSVRPKAT